MDDFSVIKTAFGGYRLLAARPMTLVWWFVFALALVLIQMVVTVEMAGPQLAAMKDMREAGQVDPASMMAVTRGLLPFYAFSYLFPWLTGALTLAAACRAVLRPNDSTFGYLRVGSDEFRLLITTLVIAVIFLVVGVVTFIIGGIVMAVTSGGALRGMQPGTPPPAAALGMLAVGSLPGVLVMVFLAVKLSLAGPQTVGQRAIEIFGSWTLTKERFWKVLATFVVGFLPIILVSCVSVAILMAGGSGGTMREKMMSMQTDMFSLDSAFDARHLVSYLVSSVTRVLVMVSVLVPSALIYQAVKPADVDVFDDDDDDDDD